MLFFILSNILTVSCAAANSSEEVEKSNVPQDKGEDVVPVKKPLTKEEKEKQEKSHAKIVETKRKVAEANRKENEKRNKEGKPEMAFDEIDG
ncbi:hypothetical protein EHP00_1665 [Ecytonucleospora hepatopenaei]|uniref:Uncharacterized protein n=1 Tax=Ecytonucleospora hepatopenaei TaxID=646526 RepID=A0A1W0E305_9MICR|nr:hypothetical protein EHP00_1665 [Ecytonucleospora hepatopenaei]